MRLGRPLIVFNTSSNFLIRVTVKIVCNYDETASGSHKGSNTLAKFPSQH